MYLCFQTRSIHVNKVEYVPKQLGQKKRPHGEPPASCQYRLNITPLQQLGSLSLFVIMVLESLRSTFFLSEQASVDSL